MPNPQGIPHTLPRVGQPPFPRFSADLGLEEDEHTQAVVAEPGWQKLEGLDSRGRDGEYFEDTGLVKVPERSCRCGLIRESDIYVMPEQRLRLVLRRGSVCLRSDVA